MESDKGQQLPVMTKNLAQPDKLSAKAAKEICRKFQPNNPEA
jgi:hypothetical protein